MRKLTASGLPPYKTILDYEPALSHEQQVYPYNHTPNAEGAGGFSTNLFVREYSLMEQIHNLGAFLDVFTILYPQLQNIDFRKDVSRLEVPVYFVEGRHEARGRSQPFQQWFKELAATHKQLITFDTAGHRTLFEQPQRFRQVMITTVLPATQPAGTRRWSCARCSRPSATGTSENGSRGASAGTRMSQGQRVIHVHQQLVGTTMKRTKTGLLVAGAALLGALPFTAAADGSSGRSHQVALRNIAINPGVLRIHRGDRVTWTWGDKSRDSSHNVTPTGKLRFRGASTRLTGTYTVRFRTPGVYYYHCTIHPFSMHAEIIVR